MTATTTKERQVEAAIGIIRAVADAIKELKEVPSGHLYAHLCGNLSLNEYNQIIEILQKSRLIIVKSNLITWVG